MIAVVLVFAIKSSAAPRENPRADASPRSYLFSASFDYTAGKDVIDDRSAADSRAAAQQQQFVIDRIDFIANHRVRSDTLTARTSSPAGDVYNQETRRRAFQPQGTT